MCGGAIVRAIGWHTQAVYWRAEALDPSNTPILVNLASLLEQPLGANDVRYDEEIYGKRLEQARALYLRALALEVWRPEKARGGVGCARVCHVYVLCRSMGDVSLTTPGDGKPRTPTPKLQAPPHTTQTPNHNPKHPIRNPCTTI